MRDILDRKHTQTLNIIDTLIEATEHFSVLIRKKETNQGIFIFSSIVEGFEAIKKIVLNDTELNASNHLENIESTILLVAKTLEKGNLLKVSEIIQFTLMPQFKSLKSCFLTNQDSEQVQKSIRIGVYLCETNPRNGYPEARINALIKQSVQQEVKLYFFSSGDVDFEKEEITADTFNNEEWERENIPFPDVIHNIGIRSRAQQSQVERKLRKILPFTSFGLGNKFSLPKKLVKSGRYAELLVPFKVITDRSIVDEFLKENKKVVFKPLLGRQGRNIYFLEIKNNRYTLLEHKKKQVLTQEEFDVWVKERILKERNSYLLQPYVECRTKNGEPYDIRAHVQKNGEGKWTLTKIYPRVGNKKSILSNISRGGRTQDLKAFFENEFGQNSKKYEENIKQLAMDLTFHLDKLHGLALDELGLDLAIDKNDRIWLHEVNNGPQTTYHEEERAVNTIAYAKYIAENGIYLTNESQKVRRDNGHFEAQHTNLVHAKLDQRYRIAMLVDENEINDLTVACAYVAKFENVHFYYFTPKDIDYDEMRIRGYFYENKQWVPRVVEYPDVIYDRLRLRGIKGYKTIYEELEGIPFTNEFFGNSISKLEVYDKLSSTNLLEDAIIPYQRVDRVKDIFHYIQHYGRVILKPEVGSFASGVHYIEKKNALDYFVAIGEKETHFNELTLGQYLRELIKKGPFIVQQYIETRTMDDQPFDIRVHMMKDGNGEWSFVNIYPRIGIHNAVISSTGNGGYIGEILGFLKRNFKEVDAGKLKEKIEKISLEICTLVENSYDINNSELGLDIAINRENSKPYIIEVNVNKPGIIYYEFEVANHAIPYAIHLAKSSEMERSHFER
ncbi:YheC/YheD family protein [Bacillus sp. SD088]|uniref:YheC/YheD family protein n=1 Tax=Bacillus sp. SD088 TaxID=2782012 RepID=UPI001A9763E4|nr:YheC/YheD family protein [Bacillus sp. SD088]MBO0992234.1 YheC/YheD family protein [Bacillus sp. SD088]